MDSSSLKNRLAVFLAVAIPLAAFSTYAYLSRKKAVSKRTSFSKSSSFYEQDKECTEVPTSNQSWNSLGFEQPLVIATVGLPARGKSYIVKMAMRYLKWIGFETKVFNVGSHRRNMGHAAAVSNFFDGNNPEGKKIREELAMAVQDSMYEWLHHSDDYKRRIAVFDATNTTRQRRMALAERAKKENVFLLFVESICDDQEVLQRNYALKLQNEDYKGMDPSKALADFMSRVHAYEKVYETIEDDEDNNQISYIKLINVGQKVITRNCHGYLPSQVAFYLQNVHIQPRKIYLTINSECIEKLQQQQQQQQQQKQRLGFSTGSKGSILSHDSNSDSTDRLAGKESGALTSAGKAYSNSLADYIRYEQRMDVAGQRSTTIGVMGDNDISVLTGTSNIHYETAAALKERGFPVFHTPLLNELRGGDFHGLTKEQIKSRYPEEHSKRVQDKLHYRYPGVGGESYLDVIERVRPVIIELERQRRSIVIVCHLAVLRCIYAYFMGVPLQDIPSREFITHRVYELSPGPFGCTCAVINPLEQSAECSPKSTANYVD